MSENEPTAKIDSDQPVYWHSMIRLLNLLDAFWMANDTKFLHEDNENSEQTARMRKPFLSIR